MNHPPIYGKKTVAVAGAMLLCGSMGLAQMNQPPSGRSRASPGTEQSRYGFPDEWRCSKRDNLRPMDRMFVGKAMQGSMAEVQLGQLTLQKSNNDQVKQFAQRMIDDHTKLNEQMKPVAQQLGVAVPNQVSKKDKQPWPSFRLSPASLRPGLYQRHGQGSQAGPERVPDGSLFRTGPDGEGCGRAGQQGHRPTSADGPADGQRPERDHGQ